jgi:hypothetical protein
MILSLFLSGLVGMTNPTASPSPPAVRHLEYQFGYDTKIAPSGPGTGTLSVDILGPAADGGVMISGTDTWWNSVRPQSTNTCEVYADGGVSCMQRPYDISAMQLVLFPLLGQNYFQGLSSDGTSTWNQAFQVTRGDLYTWKCHFTLQGKGFMPNFGRLIAIAMSGTMDEQEAHYKQGTAQGVIIYDPVAKIPAIVHDVRTHLPQTSVYNQDQVDLKLVKDSAATT